MDARDIETALKITPRFYRAALDPGAWPDVLAELAAVFAAPVGQVFLMDQRSGSVIAESTSGIPPEKLRAWLAVDNLFEADPRAKWGLSRPNMPAHERMMMSEDEWHASPFFREVMEPNGYDSAAATYTILEDDGLVACLGVVREIGEPAFDQRDVDRFQLYLPHFREAARVAGHLRRIESRRSGLEALFGVIRVATVVTDRFGRLEYRNGAAQALLAEADGVVLRRGRLATADRTAAEALRAAIFETVAPARSGGAERQVVIPRAGRHALLASVAALPADDAPTAFGAPMQAVVFLLDPERPHEGDTEVLQRLFGLTAAEAAVMKEIAAGARPAEIAEASARSLETVRTHLKAVYDKTGTKSQADLVRLAVSVLPP
jgi:DNA-binding CsgD family transcriptional regulator